MKTATTGMPKAGFTLLELLCVIAIITVLATMLSGSALKVLQRVRADHWADQASGHFRATVEQLRVHLGENSDFPLVTLERIEAAKLLRPAEVRFLKDSRVTYTPFRGADPDDKRVLFVEVRGGFFSGGSHLSVTKGDIVWPPE